MLSLQETLRARSGLNTGWLSHARVRRKVGRKGNNATDLGLAFGGEPTWTRFPWSGGEGGRGDRGAKGPPRAPRKQERVSSQRWEDLALTLGLLRSFQKHTERSC